MMEPILIPTEKGIYCPMGDFYIDPLRPVDRAVITHGHADHARTGHGHVLATPETLGIMEARYGKKHATHVQPLELGGKLDHFGVAISMHPAGHILGSAQVAVEAQGQKIVAAGDFKRALDPTCPPFEPVACDIFITEATFALPVFRHPNPDEEVKKALGRLALTPEATLMIGCYSLGKAQRMTMLLRKNGYDGPIWLHGSMVKLMHLYERFGISFGDTRPLTREENPGDGDIILCPPSAMHDRWSRRFEPLIRAMASGWMTVRARAKQKQVNVAMVVSDHADWPELLQTLDEVAAGEVWITHGREDALVRACNMRGQLARPLRMVGYDDHGDVES